MTALNRFGRHFHRAMRLVVVAIKRVTKFQPIKNSAELSQLKKTLANAISASVKCQVRVINLSHLAGWALLSPSTTVTNNENAFQTGFFVVVLFCFSSVFICFRFFISCGAHAEFCLQDPVIGHCRNASNKWFYNYNDTRCQIFTWTCGDHSNRFDTIEECIETCSGYTVATFNKMQMLKMQRMLSQQQPQRYRSTDPDRNFYSRQRDNPQPQYNSGYRSRGRPNDFFNQHDSDDNNDSNAFD